MIGPSTAFEVLRKPALALVAAAGLLTGGAGAGPAQGGATWTGDGSIQAIGHGGAAIFSLDLSGPQAPAGDLAERRQPRTTDGRGGDPFRPASVPLLLRPLPAGGVEASLTSSLARARAGRQGAPATGLPPFRSDLTEVIADIPHDLPAMVMYVLILVAAGTVIGFGRPGASRKRAPRRKPTGKPAARRGPCDSTAPDGPAAAAPSFPCRRPTLTMVPSRSAAAIATIPKPNGRPQCS